MYCSVGTSVPRNNNTTTSQKKENDNNKGVCVGGGGGTELWTQKFAAIVGQLSGQQNLDETALCR